MGFQIMLSAFAVTYLILIWRAFKSFDRIKAHLSKYHEGFYLGLSINKHWKEIFSGGFGLTVKMLNDMRWMFNYKLDFGDNYLRTNKELFVKQFFFAHFVLLTPFVVFAIYLVATI